MRIRLVEERTGPRYDGRRWPGVGVPFDVPDDEGAALCAHGIAEEVAAGLPVTAAVAAEPEAAETAPASPAAQAPVPPRVNAPRADWAAHAIGQGAEPETVDEMTKAALIAQYGKAAQAGA
jgi:hypothetical protein